MRKIFRRSVSLLLVAVMVVSMFSGCSDVNSSIDYSENPVNVDTSQGAIKNLTLSFLTGQDLTTQNPFSSDYAQDFEFFNNLYDCLVCYDSDNNVQPAVAESWESSADCKDWTFYIRNDVYWVNYKGEKQDRVTSDDFVTGLEWVLNYYKNDGNNIQMPEDFIVGAQEYFDYTTTLTEEEALALSKEKFLSMVGIEIPDENTIIYHCKQSCTYFLSLVSSLPFSSVSSKHLDEIGVDGFKINSYYDAWFNGPYILTEFIPDNERIIDANPYWYGNEDNTRFLSVTYKATESSSVALQLYKNNELDYVELYESQIRTIASDEENEYNDMLVKTLPSPYLYQYFFNYQKKNDDGTYDENWNKAVSNEAFRMSWYYGLDISNNLKKMDYISPYTCSVETINPDNLITTSDGTDYTKLVEESLGITEERGNSIRRLDKDKAEEYKKQAVAELTALGVSFPIMADYYIQSSSQSDLDSALLLKTVFEECFGDDYIKLNIKTYTSSKSREVTYPQKFSFLLTCYGPDFQDPSSALQQFLYQDDNAYISDMISIGKYTEEELNGEKSYMKSVVDEFKKFNTLYEKANAIVDDNDARCKAFAEAEAYLISHGLSIPVYELRGWSLSKIDLSSKCTIPSGCYSERLVNIKTNENGFTNSIWEEE